MLEACRMFVANRGVVQLVLVHEDSEMTSKYGIIGRTQNRKVDAG